MAPFHQLRPLPQLLPAGARGFAVVDLETTGTGQLCRIVESALLLLSPDGEIEQEWSTMINPGVPIPNAAVHGINEHLAAAAPSFSAVAPTLAALLEGRVLVAHNLDRFDGPILRHHLWEASEAWPELVVDLGDGIDTMPNPFLSLSKLCAAHGVTLSGDDAHTALGDTRALAALMRHGLPHLHPSRAPVRVAGISHSAPEAPVLLPRTTTSRKGLQQSHDWTDATVVIPAAGGTIALHGEDVHGWDFKVQKALEHATSLGLTHVTFEPEAPADVLVVSSLFIDSPLMRHLRAAGHPVVVSKVFQEVRAGAAVAAKRWGERSMSPATDADKP
ncbi:3'-5' exonuclease [Cyanobium sp. Cruz CV13-4-11]|uniref:3'-5' exonuclease n=1 Tax=unclassified Cyanobium TaxID=2627006 RepID=UPI0020CC671B|nr:MULTISPECIES: 3'-5' exonuclease [unclassified Cyanobium]MCP9901831.1 3'-5' exonuclease [Cyanobium sp. Cruz CV11-17]MCP9920814.1 3'-5' exonuclease [Cyanobium sp. Cruz CV13-4-11]